MEKLLILWHRVSNFFIDLYQHFIKVGCVERAASLTYVSLLSLVPLLSVGFSLLSAFPVVEGFKDQIQNFIFDNFVAASGAMVQEHIQGFIEQAGNLSAIGIGFLLFTAIALIYTLEKTFNAIWQVETPRKGISTFLLYWGILTLTPVFMGLGFGITSYLFSLPFIKDTSDSLGVGQLLLPLLPFILTTITFTLFYVAIPNRKVPIKYGLMGAVVAAICYEFAKKGFALYITMFPTYRLIYGALATIPIFFVWVYLSWVIVLSGAILSRTFAMGHTRRLGRKRHPVIHAFYWLGYLWQAQQQGRGLTLKDLLLLDGNTAYQVDPEVMIEYLIEANYLHVLDKSNYYLSRDLNTIDFIHFHRSLPWQLPDINVLPSSEHLWEKSLQDKLQQLETHRQQYLNVPLVEFYKK